MTRKRPLYLLGILSLVSSFPLSLPKQRAVSHFAKDSSKNDLNNYLEDDILYEDITEDVFDDLLDNDDSDIIYDYELDEETPFINIQNFTSLSMDDLIPLSTANVSYFYLRDELGLSEEALWRVTYEASSVLGMRTDNIRRKVENLRELMDLSDEDVRILLEKQPTLLQLSADKNVSPTVLYLLRTLELGRDELRSLVLACPSILGYSRSNLRTKINYFRLIMGFSIEETRSLWLDEPKLMRSSVRTGLIPHMRFLVRDIRFDRDEVRQVVKKYPRLLLLSLDRNLIPKMIFFFLMTLQLDLKQVQKIIKTFPHFLNYNLDRHILPITSYFAELEITPIEFGKVLTKYPRVITHSLAKIKYTVGYLRFELGFNASQVKRIISQAPQAFGLNPSHLKTKVSYLRDTFLLSQEELRVVISGMPTLLVLGLESNLIPKTEYLQAVFNDPVKLKQAVIRLPTLLGYSLDKRIIPRMEALLRANIDPSSITVGIPMKDEKFDVWLSRKSVKKQREAPDNPSPGIKDPVFHWTRPRK